MRKLILSMMVSVDGFIEAKGRDIDWHMWDDEMEKYMNGFLDSIDTILFGRVTYELLAGYWQTATESIAPKMNSSHKIVFSKTLKKAEWNNSRIADGGPLEEIANLKKKEGKDIVIFGGSDLASSFIRNNLIDEYRLIVNPVIVSDGKPLFTEKKNNLKLVSTKPFSCGNILLTYIPGPII